MDKQQNMDEAMLVKNIHKFIENAKLQRNGTALREGEDKISVDSALYYIDVTLNYTYCFPTESYYNTIIDSTQIHMNIENESELYFSDALSAYNDAVDSLRVLYSYVSDSNKYLIGVQCKDLGNNITNSEKQILVIAFIGIGNSSTVLSQHGAFPEDLSYWFEKDSHLCSGEGIVGAPNVLESEIIFKYKPSISPNYHVFFGPPYCDYNPEYWQFQYDDDFNNYCDYRIFYAVSTNGSLSCSPPDYDMCARCLEFNQNNSGLHEMDFYLVDGAEHILLWWLENENPDGLSFLLCNFLSYDKIQGSIEQIGHELHYKFGEKHIVPVTIGYPIPINIIPE